MRIIKSLVAVAAAAVIAGSATAQENLTGETAAAAGIANIQVADGQTLTNSIQNVAEGKTDVAGTPYILPFLLAKGRGPYSALGEEKGAELADNLRALYPVTLGYFALYAFDSKGLGGWSDLEGRNIYNGPPRGAALTNARSIIQLATGLKEGEGYKGIQTNWGLDLAKALTKAHIDSLDALKSKTPFAQQAGYGIVDVVRSGMCGANPLKYHEGAVAAWEEAGFTIDDCAKP